MASFSAVIVSTGPASARTWGPADLDPEAAGLGDLVGADAGVGVDAVADAVDDAAAGAGADASAVLVVLEREDEWFLLARAVDGDVSVFVSDADAAGDSGCADLVAGAEPPPARAASPDAADVPGGGEERSGAPGPGWAGRADLLVDHGVAPDDLVAIAEGHDTAQALAVLGERCGFADVLDALR